MVVAALAGARVVRRAGIDAVHHLQDAADLRELVAHLPDLGAAAAGGWPRREARAVVAVAVVGMAVAKAVVAGKVVVAGKTVVVRLPLHRLELGLELLDLARHQPRQVVLRELLLLGLLRL